MENKLSLVQLHPEDDGFELFLAYGTSNNFMNKAVYAPEAKCYLHPEAALKFKHAISIGKSLGLRFLVWDAFRPSTAQWELWNFCPNSEFVADPKIGSCHTRGIAIDLTLVDSSTGSELDMGTIFDEFKETAYHGNAQISIEAQKNRLLLLGIMTQAGFDFYDKEWWHYQLFNSKSYPLISGDYSMSKNVTANSA